MLFYSIWLLFFSKRQDQYGAAREIHPPRRNHTGDGELPLPRPQISAVVQRSISQQVHLQSELPHPSEPSSNQHSQGSRDSRHSSDLYCTLKRTLTVLLSSSSCWLFFLFYLPSSSVPCFFSFDLWIPVFWFAVVPQTPQHITRNYDKPWLTNSKPSTPLKSSESFESQGSSSEV